MEDFIKIVICDFLQKDISRALSVYKHKYSAYNSYSFRHILMASSMPIGI